MERSIQVIGIITGGLQPLLQHLDELKRKKHQLSITMFFEKPLGKTLNYSGSRTINIVMAQWYSFRSISEGGQLLNMSDTAYLIRSASFPYLDISSGKEECVERNKTHSSTHQILQFSFSSSMVGNVWEMDWDTYK